MSKSTLDHHPSPQEIPGFEYVGVIHGGGQATVYRYRSTDPNDHGEQFAVKIYHDASSPLAEDEVEILRRFRNNAIVSPLPGRVGRTADGRRYFVMRLYHRLDDGRELSVQDVLEIGITLARALHYAHGQSMLHLDVKPANVLTDDDGNPLLSDFGIASRPGERIRSMSPAWSPPEQQRGESLFPSADVFALGATLLIVLARSGGAASARSVYDALGEPNDAEAWTARARRDEVKLPALDEKRVPVELQNVLRRAVAADPAARWQTADAFRRALEGVRRHVRDSDVTVTWPLGEAEAIPVEQPASPTGEDPSGLGRVVALDAIANVSDMTTWTSDDADSTIVPPQLPAGVATSATTWSDTTLGRQDPTVHPVDPDSTISHGATPSSLRRLPSRFLRIGGAVAGIVTLAVVAFVAVPAILEIPTSPTSPPADTVSSPFDTPIPTPVLESASASGGSVTFRWSNPDAEDGDSFIWTRTDGPNDSAAFPTDETSAVIEGVNSAAIVCIEVVVRREGRTSSTPLSSCFPE